MTTGIGAEPRGLGMVASIFDFGAIGLIVKKFVEIAYIKGYWWIRVRIRGADYFYQATYFRDSDLR